MTKQEIESRIKKAEAGLTNPAVPPEAKPKLQGIIDSLKKELAEMEKPAPAAVVKAEEAATVTKTEQKGMSEAEIRSAIAKIKAGLNNPMVPDAQKPKLRAKLAELQESIGEKAEEEKEVKAVAKDAEKKIKQAEKQIASPATPAKQKAALKKRVQAVKKVVKEAKADAEKQTEARRRGRPRKEAVAKAPAKRGRPAKAAPAAKKTVVKRATKAQVAKPAPKPVVAKKRVVKRATKSAAKVKTAVSSLEKLVRRTAELRAMYAGKGVDLDRDAARGSKRPGWRIAGSNRRPTKADIKAGRAYWEARPNRADVQKSNYPKLAKGGMMSDGASGKKKNDIEDVLKQRDEVYVRFLEKTPVDMYFIANSKDVENDDAYELMDVEPKLAGQNFKAREHALVGDENRVRVFQKNEEHRLEVEDISQDYMLLIKLGDYYDVYLIVPKRVIEINQNKLPIGLRGNGLSKRKKEIKDGVFKFHTGYYDSNNRWKYNKMSKGGMM